MCGYLDTYYILITVSGKIYTSFQPFVYKFISSFLKVFPKDQTFYGTDLLIVDLSYQSFLYYSFWKFELWYLMGLPNFYQCFLFHFCIKDSKIKIFKNLPKKKCSLDVLLILNVFPIISSQHHIDFCNVCFILIQALFFFSHSCRATEGTGS